MIRQQVARVVGRGEHIANVAALGKGNDDRADPGLTQNLDPPGGESATSILGVDVCARSQLIKEVLDVMRELADEDMTMIVVTHEIGFARDVGDRAVFMDGRVIVERGPAQAGDRAPEGGARHALLGLVLEH